MKLLSLIVHSLLALSLMWVAVALVVLHALGKWNDPEILVEFLEVYALFILCFLGIVGVFYNGIKAVKK